MRNIDRVAGGHEHGHRLADGAADAQQHGGEQAVLRCREEDAINHLPARRAEGHGGFAVAVGHGLEGVLADADHDGDTHQREQQRGVEEVHTDWDVEHRDDDRAHHAQADEAPHDAGNGGQQFDDNLERLLGLARAEFGHENRRTQAERHRDEHGQGRDAHGADEERADAVFGLDGGGGNPLLAGEELDEVQLGQEGRAFLEDEEENPEDEDDGADAAEINQRFDHALADQGEDAARGSLEGR